jgi:hypothetical protein
MTTGEASGCPVNANFDPLSENFLSDPSAVLAGLPWRLNRCFDAESIGYYVITRYADIEQVVRDPETYSAAVAHAPLEPLIPAAQQILLAAGHRPQQPQATSFAVATGRGRWPCRRTANYQKGYESNE